MPFDWDSHVSEAQTQVREIQADDADVVARQIWDMVDQAHDAMTAAQQRQKKHKDNRRLKSPFVIGDMVMLNVRNPMMAGTREKLRA